jgi:hypothetical protein
MIPEELIADLTILKDRGYVYEVPEDGGRVYVVFKGFPLPQGVYNLERTDLLIFTTPHYPNAGFDMFWVDAGLTLKSGGVPKSADSIESYLGRQWRRFSYHPYNSKPWNPSEDNVASFMAYVEQRLRRGD